MFFTGVRPSTPLYSDVHRLRAVDVDALARPVTFELTHVLYVNLRTGEERNVTNVFAVHGGDKILNVAPLDAYTGGMFEVGVVASNGQGDGDRDVATVKVRFSGFGLVGRGVAAARTRFFF